jgi:diguanylate cyclase (GGDEF)-like protein
VQKSGARRGRLWHLAALVGGLGSAIGAASQLAILEAVAGPLPLPLVVGCIAASGGAAALIAAVIVERLVARRLRDIARFVEGADAGDYLLRIPVTGDDELAEAGDALNQLLARVTSLRVSLLDQGRELAQTREKLHLEETLAAKTHELEARLAERQLVFDLLRVSVSETELDAVLRALVVRIGHGLQLREAAILLRVGEAAPRYVIRAVHGFAEPERVLGRELEADAGVVGEIARSGAHVIVDDVASDSEYRAFWEHGERTGSFGAFPLQLRGSLLGILGVTRAPSDPLTDVQRRLLTALADQVALAIRHAQVVDELRALSTTDELTRLANRRALGRRLDREIERAERFGHPLAVVAIDIDFFKILNDTAGHPTGDAALRVVAATLVAGVRRIDTVARMGGEEFLALLPETALDEASVVAEKLRERIESETIPGGATQPGGRLTISLGVAARVPGETAEALLARADEALYAAKRHGRNRVQVHAGAALSVPAPPRG